MPPKSITVKVITPEAELEFAIHSSTTGKQLFDQVVKTLGIREIWYFALRYTDSQGLLSWVKLNRKVTAQDIPHAKVGGPLLFHFLARFFPEDASEELIQEITIRLFFLQIKQSILYEEIYCPPETAVLLASYACQAGLGDYSLELHKQGHMSKEALLPARIIEQHKLKISQWEEKICTWWKEHQGLLKEEAMLEFLKIAQDLEMYGVSYFEIKNKKGSELFIGVDALGLNVYQINDKLTPKIGFPWSEIRNISFSDKKFCIKSTDRKAPDFIFFARRARVNKNILSLCMGNHELYTRRRREDTIDVQQMKSRAKEIMLQKKMDRDRLRNEREARQEIEQKLQRLQMQMTAQTQQTDRTLQTVSNYKEKIHRLEVQLEEENRMRRELEKMREKLERNNMALEQEKNTTSTEYRRLKEENYQIRSEIENKNHEMKHSSSRMNEYQDEMERLRKEREYLEAKARDFEEKYTSACQRIPSPTQSDRSSSLINSSGTAALPPVEMDCDMDDENKSFDQDFATADVESPLNRNEENRSRAIDSNESLQAKLKNLSSDLRSQRDQTKVGETDILHEENQKAGRDKFKTLKQIRQGNTKKRIDEFESM